MLFEWDEEKAAANWNEALPLGNGFMGAMCFGGNVIDRFQLNLDSLWHGGFRDRVNPDAKANIPEIQRLIAAGEIRKAEKLAELAMAAVSRSIIQKVFMFLWFSKLYHSDWWFIATLPRAIETSQRFR